jgi:hypothetical protein
MNEGKAVLIVQDVKPEDEGKYTVTARNLAGVGSSVASLVVRHVPGIDDKSYVNPEKFQRFELKTPESTIGQPIEVASFQARIKIIEPLRDTFITEGSQVVLNCKIDAYPKAEVTWFKDGQPLRASDRHSTFYDMYTGMAILRLKTAFNDDRGTYECVATNIAGRESTFAQLLVQQAPGIDETSYIDPDVLRKLEDQRFMNNGPDQEDFFKKPYFIKVPKSTEVKEGVPVRFDCVAFGRPAPTLAWFKNGVPIIDGPEHKLFINEEGVHSLLIPSVKFDDAAVYTCVASNKVGEASFQVALKVVDKDSFKPPYFIEHLRNLVIPEGKDAVLSCTAAGTPVPSLIWEKDGFVLTPDKEFRIDINGGHSKLHIQSAEKIHEGWYQCTATSPAGTVVTRTKVTVIRKLSIFF